MPARSKATPMLYGPVAQLGARLNGIEKVRGSNPLRSTKNCEPAVALSTTNTGGITELPFVPICGMKGFLFWEKRYSGFSYPLFCCVIVFIHY